MTNPIERFKETLARAEAAGLEKANAMSLSTISDEGKPTVRIMLLKEADERGFVFYTNLKSRKGKGLIAHPYASLCFWWRPLNEQIRVEGLIEPVKREEADDYFHSRPRRTQAGACVSKQSDVLASRDQFIREVDTFEAKYQDQEIPRPEWWSGYRVIPERIEFWKDQEDRLHLRTLYLRDGNDWKTDELYP